MVSIASLAYDRQRQMVRVADLTRNRALRMWSQFDFSSLDLSWASRSEALTATVSIAQLRLAEGSDLYNSQVSSVYGFEQDSSVLLPEAFAGVDGAGRDVGGVLFGAVTTTKEAVAAGLGRSEAMRAGAGYLAAVVKTLLADTARSADKVSGAGKGYTHWVRVVNGAACSRCAILAGLSSAEEAFKRHTGCQCGTVPVPGKNANFAKGVPPSPEAYFNSLTKAEQDRLFTKAGADAIRLGASPAQVVNARRGASGMGYSQRTKTPVAQLNRMTKATVAYRPNGDPIRLYTTSEGTTGLGKFGRRQANSAGGRIRLMPEQIFEIAGNDRELVQAFLRDAGYLEYIPEHGFGPNWVAEMDAQRRADRILVDRATLRFGNFTLG